MKHSIPSPPAREHYWDLIRAALLLLGLPYHAALIYSSRVNWAVHSPEMSQPLTYLASTLSAFRMPCFFLMAGYFALMMLQRSGSQRWFNSRLIRLGIPLVAAAILFNPFQILAAVWSDAVNGRIAVADVWSIFTDRTTEVGGQWIRHLWFLTALIVYSAILAGLYGPLRRIVGKYNHIANALASTSPTTTMVVLALVSGLWLVSVDVLFYGLRHFGFREPLNGLFTLQAILTNIVFFFLGAWSWSNSAIKSFFRSGGSATLITGILLSLAYACVEQYDTGLAKIAGPLIKGLAAIWMARGMISICATYLDKPSIIVRRLVDSSFTIYLVHQPIISLLGALFITFPLYAEIEFAIITVATFIFSYAIHILVAKSDLALFILNGIPVRRINAGSHA